MTPPDTEELAEGGADEEESPQTPFLDAASTGPVLTDAFSEEELDELGRDISADFDADVESCEGFVERVAEWNKLYDSVMEKKTFPFDRAANVNLPVLQTTLLQIHGRIYDMINPAKGNVFHSVPLHTDPEEVARAIRTEILANYWARHECTEFNTTLDVLSWRTVFYGSNFSAMDWDENEGRATYESVPIEDMVVPWDARSARPDMKDVPRYTWVRRMTFWDIQRDIQRGFFRDVPEMQPEDTKDDDRNPLQAYRDKNSGLSKSGDGGTTKKDGLRKVLIHYCKRDLPEEPAKHEAFDGRQHALRVWVDHETMKVLRVVLREEPDPRDQARFQKEQGAYLQYVSQQAHFEASGGVTMDPMTGLEMPIPPPTPVEEPKPQRVREITFHTHWKGFNSEGFYGLGYGAIVSPINKAMNAMVNQKIDLMTINNAGGGYKSRQVRFPSGNIMHQPGQWVDVDAMPDALKNGLVPRQVQPGDPATPQMLEMLESWVQKATGSGETLAGEPSKSNETATAATNRYDAAVKQISVLASRMVQSYMKNDVEMLWRLFAAYLPDEDYKYVINEQGQSQQIPVAARDFAAESRVYPVADPRVITRQDRIQDAQQFLMLATQDPMLASNPQVRFFALQNYLTAMDKHEVLAMLKPPAPPPPVPQQDENADFLRGKQPQVHPQDNDAEHLADMATFKVSPEFKAMTPEMQSAYEQHGRNHIAAKMQKERQNAPQGAPPVPGMAAVGNDPGAGLAPS